MARRRKQPSTNTSDTITTTKTTEKDFETKLNQKRIYYGRYQAKAPKDINVVKERLQRTRESPPPGEEEYSVYAEQVELNDNESSTLSNLWQLLAKHPRRTQAFGYSADYHITWSEIDNSLTFGLSSAIPDISEGYRIWQYPQDAREALGGALAPSQRRGAMPTLCVEAKGPDGAMPCAERQCAYDGALMTHAAYEAHTYMGKDPGELFNKIQALTVAFNGELVKVFGSHMVNSGRNLEYHQYLMLVLTPGSSFDDFAKSRNIIRNVQDLACERATQTKNDLEAYAHANEAEPDNSPETGLPESCADERLQCSPPWTPPTSFLDTLAAAVAPPLTTTPFTSNQGGPKRQRKPRKKTSVL